MSFCGKNKFFNGLVINSEGNITFLINIIVIQIKIIFIQ